MQLRHHIPGSTCESAEFVSLLTRTVGVPNVTTNARCAWAAAKANHTSWRHIWDISAETLRHRYTGSGMVVLDFECDLHLSLPHTYMLDQYQISESNSRLLCHFVHWKFDILGFVCVLSIHVLSFQLRTVFRHDQLNWFRKHTCVWEVSQQQQCLKALYFYAPRDSISVSLSNLWWIWVSFKLLQASHTFTYLNILILAYTYLFVRMHTYTYSCMLMRTHTYSSLLPLLTCFNLLHSLGLCVDEIGIVEAILFVLMILFLISFLIMWLSSYQKLKENDGAGSSKIYDFLTMIGMIIHILIHLLIH